MHRRLGVLVGMLSLILAACGPQAAQGPAANTFTVQVDAGKGQPFAMAATAFFPNEFTAHPGDTLQFKYSESGEPHTVTFGTLADAAILAIAKIAPPPGAPPPTGPPPPDPPELKKLPDLLPPPTGPEPPSVLQSAAQPCFLSTGEPPAKDACAKTQQKQSDFDGKQTFYNSGWLEPEKTFSVKLSDSIKPGNYGYICLLHRAGMIGKVTVVDKKDAIPGADQVQSRGKDQVAKIVQKLQGAVDTARKQATADKAVAGVLSLETRDALASIFGPKDVVIPVGGKVTWTVFGPHTISFNAPEDARPILLRDAGGAVRLNPKAVLPANSPGAPLGPPPGPPPPGPPKPLAIDAGAWDGKGFRSSGLILSFPPAFTSYSVRFTQAGTYPFKCLIHTDMEGTVKVG